MSEYEVNLKVNVDSTEVDETIDKLKKLTEAIEVMNGLMEELASANTVNITGGLSMDSKKLAQELYHSQLAKEHEDMNARIKGGLNRSRY